MKKSFLSLIVDEMLELCEHILDGDNTSETYELSVTVSGVEVSFKLEKQIEVFDHYIFATLDLDRTVLETYLVSSVIINDETATLEDVEHITKNFQKELNYLFI